MELRSIKYSKLKQIMCSIITGMEKTRFFLELLTSSPDTLVKRSWVFTTNSDFLITVYYTYVDLRYFKLLILKDKIS